MLGQRVRQLWCVGLVGLAPAVVSAAPTVIRGAVGFDATYYELDFASDAPLLDDGAIPRGLTGVDDLLLCAYAAQGAIDAATAEAAGEGDDRLLGCARAAKGSGAFTITIPDGAIDGLAGADLYLLTWYCDGLVGGASLELPGGAVIDGDGRHCVRLNTTAASAWDAAPDPSGARVKYTYSARYPGALSPGEDHVVAWNLSCPGEAQWGADGLVACVGDADPWEPATCAGAPSDVCIFGQETSTNSSAGWNREAVHMYRAAAQSRFFLPDAETTAAGATLWSPAVWPTIELLLAPALVGPEGAAAARCDDRSQALGLNGERREVCLEGRVLSNPFVVLHEIAHVLHARWIDSPARYGGGPECADPRNLDGDEIRRTNEGFCDFYAAAMWFAPDDPGAFWGRRDRGVEDAAGPWVTPVSCPAAGGERRETQFFWDLYDALEDGDGDAVDRTSVGVDAILRTWSRFTIPCGDVPANRHSSEPGCAARNVADFSYHFAALYGDDDVRAALTINCMDGYSDPLDGGAASSLSCPAPPAADAPDDGGCSCVAGSRRGGALALLWVVAAGRRRRRASPRGQVP